MKLWDQAAWLTKKWPTIKGFAEGVDKGTCAEIKHNGRALVFHLYASRHAYSVFFSDRALELYLPQVLARRNKPGQQRSA